MPIDTRNAKILTAARAAIKAGDLAKAQNYLLMAEGEEAEKLLERVNKAIAARGTAPKAEAQVTSKAVAEGIKQAEKEKAAASGKAMGQGCLVLIAIMVVCFVIFTATNQPSLEKSRAQVCVDALRGMPMGTRCRLDEFPDEVALCYNRLGDYADINSWYDCLLEQGVGSNMLDFPN